VLDQTTRHEGATVIGDSASVSSFALARAAAVLAEHPSVGMVFVGRGRGAPLATWPGHRWLRLAAAHGPDTMGGSCAVLRPAALEAAGWQSLATRSGQLSLWLRLAALADVARVAEPHAALPLSPSEPAAPRVGEIPELHERALAFRELFAGSTTLRDETRLRWSVYRTISRRARARAWVAAYEGDMVEARLCRHLATDVDRWRRRR
jgi:hypothetical protein